VEVHEVPGYHGELVAEPLVGVVATQLRESLKRAEQAESGEGGAGAAAKG
jgi:hypothetical protein